jgi:hypothetical protein
MSTKNATNVTTLHRLATRLNVDPGTAARAILRGKGPACWRGRHRRTVRALLEASTPRLEKQAAFIARRDEKGIL